MSDLRKFLNAKKRPFKQYLRRAVKITHDHDREIRLLQAAIKDKGSSLEYSEILEKIIDHFFDDVNTAK